WEAVKIRCVMMLWTVEFAAYNIRPLTSADRIICSESDPNVPDTTTHSPATLPQKTQRLKTRRSSHLHKKAAAPYSGRQ
ncbi:hypothetical protein PFISCL1PPCAC_23239, partial [Pristionchus fissidentatus]